MLIQNIVDNSTIFHPHLLPNDMAPLARAFFSNSTNKFVQMAVGV